LKILYKLLKFELLVYNRSYHLIRNNIYALLLSSVVFSIAMPGDVMTNYIKMLMCFWGVVFSSLTIPHYLIKSDLQDGFLETLLCSASPIKIVVSKYLALTLSLIISMLISIGFMVLFFSFSNKETLYLLLLMTLAILQIAAFILLGNIVHSYFRSNTNLLIALILPLVIPTLIIGASALETLRFDFVMILLGIDMVTIPTTFFLSSYLLSNLYDF